MEEVHGVFKGQVEHCVIDDKHFSKHISIGSIIFLMFFFFLVCVSFAYNNQLMACAHFLLEDH